MNKQWKSAVSKHLMSIILSIPKAKRIAIADEVVGIKKLCGLDDVDVQDIIHTDRRGKHWAERSEEEKVEVQRRQMEKARIQQKELRDKVKALREEKLEYRVIIRGESDECMNLIHAAKVVNKSPKTLYSSLHKSKDKTKHFTIEGKVITIKKIK